jgi:hypothetical protein
MVKSQGSQWHYTAEPRLAWLTPMCGGRPKGPLTMKSLNSATLQVSFRDIDPRESVDPLSVSEFSVRSDDVPTFDCDPRLFIFLNGEIE